MRVFGRPPGFWFGAQSLVAVTACLLLAACGSSAPEEVESKTVVPVSVAAAQFGTMTGSIHATGVITPAPGAELAVVAPEPARIAEIPKAEGDTVRRGDLLVRFEIPSTGAEAEKQRAEVSRAQARLRTATAAQARARDLFDRGVAARKEIEDADKEVADAEADLASAQAALSAAQTVAARSVVRATFDGVVAKRSHNPGDLVDANAVDPVIRVVDPRRLEVSASIPIADVPRVAVGQIAHLRREGDEPIALKVVSRPTTVSPGTAAVPIRLAFATATAYAIGTPVEIDIDAEQHKDVLVVPSEALVREGGDTAVFVAADNKAQRRSVMVGLEDSAHVEIRSGVKAGEMVITRGHLGLPDGAAVTITKETQESDEK